MNHEAQTNLYDTYKKKCIVARGYAGFCPELFTKSSISPRRLMQMSPNGQCSFPRVCSYILKKKFFDIAIWGSRHRLEIQFWVKKILDMMLFCNLNITKNLVVLK